MKELIEQLKKENQDILHKNPKLAIEFDWSGDAYRLQYNEEMIGKLKNLIIANVSNQRELLIAFMDSFDNDEINIYQDAGKLVDEFLAIYSC